MAASSKIHLVLRGGALCDYQWRNPRNPRGVIVALYAKGRAKADRSGFVVDLL